MKPEKYFKHIRRFWFQTHEGKRLTADACCVILGQPAEIKIKRESEQFNSGIPIERNVNYYCANCGKQLKNVKG